MLPYFCIRDKVKKLVFWLNHAVFVSCGTGEISSALQYIFMYDTMIL